MTPDGDQHPGSAPRGRGRWWVLAGIAIVIIAVMVERFVASIDRIQTRISLDTVGTELLFFHQEHGHWPGAEARRQVLADCERRSLCQIRWRDDDWVDRWDTPISCQLTSDDSFRLRSGGPDRVLHTRDDIVATVAQPVADDPGNRSGR